MPYLVKHLQFDSFPVELDCSDFEVHPNCGNVRLCVGIVRKPKRISGFRIQFDPQRILYRLYDSAVHFLVCW